MIKIVSANFYGPAIPGTVTSAEILPSTDPKTYAVTNLSIVDGGAGYSAAPTVAFVGNTSSVQPTATAVLTAGIVTSITITNAGVSTVPPTGYTLTVPADIPIVAAGNTYGSCAIFKNMPCGEVILRSASISVLGGTNPWGASTSMDLLFFTSAPASPWAPYTSAATLTTADGELLTAQANFPLLAADVTGYVNLFFAQLHKPVSTNVSNVFYPIRIANTASGIGTLHVTPVLRGTTTVTTTADKVKLTLGFEVQTK